MQMDVIVKIKYKMENIKSEVRVLRAPKYDITFENENDITIFLAGPIQGATEWHDEVINKIIIELKNFRTNKNIIICSPKRTKIDNNFNYDEQVDWESYYLEKASKSGIIVFWLAKEKEKIEGRSYSQTSRFEIGEWFAKGQYIKDFKIIVGADKDFEGLKYINKKFTDVYPKFSLSPNIEDVVNEILLLIYLK